MARSAFRGGPVIYAPWAIQFVFECSGAILAHRKRLGILSSLLAWRALADLITFPFYIWDRLHYAAVMWPCRAVQYVILYALGIELAAKMIAEYQPLTQYRYKVWAMGASVNVWLIVTTELWEHKFFFADAATSLLLLGVVCLAWIGKKKGLEEPWKLISGGILLSSIGNSLCAIASTYSSRYLSLYPVPAILALLIWNLSVLPRKPKPILLEEARLDLGKKHPVSHFLCGSEQRRVI